MHQEQACRWRPKVETRPASRCIRDQAGMIEKPSRPWPNTLMRKALALRLSGHITRNLCPAGSIPELFARSNRTKGHKYTSASTQLNPSGVLSSANLEWPGHILQHSKEADRGGHVFGGGRSALLYEPHQNVCGQLWRTCSV